MNNCLKSVILFITLFFSLAARDDNGGMHFLPWSEERELLLTSKAQETVEHNLNNFPIFPYPDSNAEEILATFQQTKIYIFAYGSLLNKQSAAKALSPEAMKTHRPAIAFGLKRIFNRYIPKETHWGEQLRPNDKAMLNVFQTSNYQDIINGVVIEVGQEDLQNLIKREEGYDLVPIPVTYWVDALDSNNHDPSIFFAYTFISPEKAVKGIHYTKKDINPIKGYALASQEGASQYGDQFFKLWIETTFLADKKTPFKIWKDNPSVDCLDETGCRLPLNP